MSGPIYFNSYIQPNSISERLSRVLLFLLFCFTFSELHAQQYFQQEVKYKINVALDDKKHQLSAYEEIIYTNHSNATLNELYFHLWPNAYYDENTFLAREYYKTGNWKYKAFQNIKPGFIDSLDFQVNDETVRWALLPDTIDICKITLNRPLNPGDSIKISTPFRVKIPDASYSRLGHSDQAYYITQWYPKPAVFDQHGWNYFPYLDKGEFYSEFGSFDVNITLPQNYVVGSTGELQNNPQEEEWLNSKAKETSGLNEFVTDMSFPASSTEMKTLHYYQDRIHDFAWFADKRFHVLKGDAGIPGTSRRITTWSLFTNAEPQLWKKVPEILANSISYLSRWAGAYPYNQVTAVDVGYASGSGMEYPMITAIGTEGYAFGLEDVIVHEVAHNWYYGILGSNERLHPWMDEGLSMFFETRYYYTHYAKDASLQEENFYRAGSWGKSLGLATLNLKKSNYMAYIYGARKNADLSPDLSSEKYGLPAYHEDVYRKTAMGFEHLLSYLGDSSFDVAMNAYYDSWKFKHPEPGDMKKSFEKSTGKNLSWLFDDFLETTKKPDYALSGLKKKEAGKYNLKIKNKGSVEAPLTVNGLNKGKIISSERLEGFSGLKSISITCDSCDAFRIDKGEHELDLRRRNNSIRTQGILKQIEKLRFQFPGGIENPERTQIFYSPIAGWNMYNQVMAGAAVYNIFSPEKKFEYVIAPMYSFRLNEIAGSANLYYHLYPYNSLIQKITLQTGISRYAYADDYYDNNFYNVHYSSSLHYTKLNSEINLLFRNSDDKEKLTRAIRLRHIFLKREMPFGIAFPFEYWFERKFEKRVENQNFFQLEGSSVNTNPFYANSQKVSFTIGKEFYKAFIETKNFISYGKRNKGLDVRLFAGLLSLSKTSQSGIDYSMRLSGTDGSHDYLFDEIFPGRNANKGVFAQQFVVADAGFKMPTFFYRKANQWMVGINASTSLPGLLPFRLFADIGSFNDAQSGYPGARAISWEWGVELPIIKDIFVLYFPITYSEDLKYIVDREELHYGNLVRFEFHLNKLNPLNYFRHISF